MYADDTTLFSTYDKFETIDDKNIETIENNINKELSLIVTLLHRNKLLINTTKTKMTIFHTPHCEVTYPRIKINNSSVEVVDEFKFLGIFIDKHLKWSTHTEFIANKISKYTGVINRLKHTLPPRILLTLYNTLILHIYTMDFYSEDIIVIAFSSSKTGQFGQYPILNSMGTQNQYVNYLAYLNYQTYINFSFTRCITKER